MSRVMGFRLVPIVFLVLIFLAPLVAHATEIDPCLVYWIEKVAEADSIFDIYQPIVDYSYVGEVELATIKVIYSHWDRDKVVFKFGDFIQQTMSLRNRDTVLKPLELDKRKISKLLTKTPEIINTWGIGIEFPKGPLGFPAVPFSKTAFSYFPGRPHILYKSIFLTGLIHVLSLSRDIRFKEEVLNLQKQIEEFHKRPSSQRNRKEDLIARDSGYDFSLKRYLALFKPDLH